MPRCPGVTSARPACTGSSAHSPLAIHALPHSMHSCCCHAQATGDVTVYIRYALYNSVQCTSCGLGDLQVMYFAIKYAPGLLPCLHTRDLSTTTARQLHRITVADHCWHSHYCHTNSPYQGRHTHTTTLDVHMGGAYGRPCIHGAPCTHVCCIHINILCKYMGYTCV